MTNFYEELGIGREKKIDEINAELSRLESTWKRREITNPEKATAKLALIIEARKVFGSDASKRKYDNELDNSLKEPEKSDPESEQSAALNKWKSQARSYYSSGQYDLAKIAVEKAIALSDINGDDDDLFALCANIYSANGDMEAAINYINRAIVSAPGISAHYITKALLFDSQSFEAVDHKEYYKATNLCNESRKMLKIAEQKANVNGDTQSRARAYGALAFSFYFQEPIDKNEGERYANLAVECGGDSWGNADKVLTEVNRLRIEKETAEKNNIYNSAKEAAQKNNILFLNRAIEIYQSLDGWRDSKEQIKNCKKRIAAIEQAEIEAEKEQKEKETRRQQSVYDHAALIASSNVISHLEQAISEFKSLGNFKDSLEMIEKIENKIQIIIEEDEKERIAKHKHRIKALFTAGICFVVIAMIFLISGTIISIQLRKPYIEHYNTALTYLDENRYQEAALEFGRAADYKDANERSMALWKEWSKPSIVSVGSDKDNRCIAAIKNDGTAVTTNRYSYRNISDWNDLVSISVGKYHIAALKSNGTVVAEGDNSYGQCDVQAWKNIISIVSGDAFTAGLKTDGSVVIAGAIANVNKDERNNIDSWDNIISIWSGHSDDVLIAKTVNGDILAVGDTSSFNYGTTDLWESKEGSVWEWNDIVQIDSGYYRIVGLKSDGSVVAAGIVEGVWVDYTVFWKEHKDITSIAAGDRTIVGLKADGTVVFNGKKQGSSWKDIVAIDSDSGLTIGVKSDGTVLITGDYDWRVSEPVSEWNNIMIP